MDIYYYNLPGTCLRIKVDNKHLVGIEFVNNYWQNRKNSDIDNIFLKQLDEYFCNKRDKFNLPIKFVTGTPFQKKVWQNLSKIPYGKTNSYKELATKVGDEKKARAVASACRANPIPIVIPCHRVIAANGSLGGYAGGAKLKEWLLDLERMGVEEKEK